MSYRREINKELKYKRKSKVFLLPLLQTPLLHINNEVNYLIDVLIVQEGFPQIVVIFDNVDYEPLKMDIYKLQNCPEYIDAVFDDSDKEVVMFFDIPKDYREDFELFTQGKYSRFSHKYKEMLTKKYGESRMLSFSSETKLPNVSIYDAIYPTQERKEALSSALKCDIKEINDEVLSPPEVELEEYKTIEELKYTYDKTG